jgi:hypothetical protein
MREASIGGCIGGTTGCEGGAAAGAAHLLSLAAAPTFAIMALLTGALDGGALDLLCSATQRASSANGMTVMYLLMTALHIAPWLKLLANPRDSTRGA